MSIFQLSKYNSILNIYTVYLRGGVLEFNRTSEHEPVTHKTGYTLRRYKRLDAVGFEWIRPCCKRFLEVWRTWCDGTCSVVEASDVRYDERVARGVQLLLRLTFIYNRRVAYESYGQQQDYEAVVTCASSVIASLLGTNEHARLLLTLLTEPLDQRLLFDVVDGFEYIFYTANIKKLMWMSKRSGHDIPELNMGRFVGLGNYPPNLVRFIEQSGYVRRSEVLYTLEIPQLVEEIYGEWYYEWWVVWTKPLDFSVLVAWAQILVDTKRRRFELRHIFVAPEIRRKGVASSIMHNLINKAINESICFVHTTCAPHLTAFYARFGMMQVEKADTTSESSICERVMILFNAVAFRRITTREQNRLLCSTSREALRIYEEEAVRVVSAYKRLPSRSPVFL